MDTHARSNATRAVPWLAPRYWLAFSVLAIGAAIAALSPAEAQDESVGLATDEELHEIVGPIALYPDDLVAIVLPASTYPLQIVQAARFLEDQKNDSSLKPDQEWDDSVVALLNYPEVVKLLNDDLDWTYDLGTAVLNQRADVLDAVQGFRDEAYAAGNLRSDERQTVALEDDTIEIKPADPEVIYVPYYEPERVVVYQPAPVYYYYPRPYPVYYYPYPAYHTFHTGFFWGVNTWFSIGWHSHYVHVYDPFYHGHPYYGWTYYNPFYVRNVYVNVNHHYPNYVWEPRYRYGGRPGVNGSEGRVYTADRRPRHGVLDSTTRTTEGRSYRTTDGRPPPTGTTQAGNTPRGRSTFAREPLGRSTQTAGASRGRGTLAQEPMGRSAQTRETGASSDPARAQPGQGASRSGGGMSQARGQAQTDASAQPQAEVRGRGQAQARQPSAPERVGSATSQSYRSGGGGMSQAMGRSRATTQPSGDASTSPGTARTSPGASPRAHQPSTGMPREASRPASPPRASAPATREPSHGGGMGAQRSASGGGSRGNSGGQSNGNAGSNYSGGNGGGHSGGGNSGGGNTRGGGGSARSAQR